MHYEIFKNTILPLKDKLFRFAVGVLNDADEAADIVQDTMLKIWNKRDEWGNIDNMEGYCFRTIRNLVWDRIQSKDYQNEPYDASVHDRLDNKNPLVKLEENEQVKLIRELIHSLPEPQRTTMHLRDIEGLPYLEIAAYLAISESQVKNHLFRGRQKIKQLFEKIYSYEHP